jgi:hypothetical protein
MRQTHHPDDRSPLLPEGRRWGFGANGVVPYLTAALESRPAEAADPAADIRNPVFPQMEKALRALRRRR